MAAPTVSTLWVVVRCLSARTPPYKTSDYSSLRKKEQFFYVSLVIAFLLSVLFLFVWIETSNEYNSFDWVVYLGTGRWFLWSILVLCAAGILAAYTSLLLLLGFLLLWERIELNLHTSHKVLIFIVIFLCSILLGVLSHFWKDKWLIVGLSLQIFAPFVALQLAAGLSFLIILLFLYLMPLGIYSPCVLQKESLGPKPALFGHRGAPMMAPENTMMSFEKAVEFDAFGLETDIFIRVSPVTACSRLGDSGYELAVSSQQQPGLQFLAVYQHMDPLEAQRDSSLLEWSSYDKLNGLSIPHDRCRNSLGDYFNEKDVINYDQVPFLMHDYDLTRTTNIREVLPSAARNHSSYFNWTFLSTLNAGKWFLKTTTSKPFFNMKPLSEADKIKAGNQSIPRLSELLELAKREQKFVLFDLFGPAPGHPLRNTFVRRVVRVILDSNIEQHLIFWLPGFDRDYVKYMAPGFQQVGRLWSIEELKKNNISIINVDYKRLFYAGLRTFANLKLDYKKAKIYINVYVINEPWLFSLAWCSRVNSVTTDNIELLNQLSHPLFFMTSKHQDSTCSCGFSWMFFLRLSLVWYFVITASRIKELRKERWLEASASADIERINLPQEKSEIQSASHLPNKPPARIGRSPWTPKVHYGSSSRREKIPPPRTIQSVKDPKKKPVPFKNTVKPLTQGFQHTKTSAREISLRTPEPTLKGDEVAESLTEYSHAKTRPNTPMVDSSEESASSLESITSNVSYKMPLKKKRP
ncbi:Glycerophosphodiester phosphodiesterase domain-containing protein 4 [Apodemus speciosus]|uniref:Glycerophosphodiester phosphodiesterase domain-containing protein 4 n=1 Tax=Apodemus speciosus TaxID=105296 RepID=A0ABQ0EZH5_APOSI